jgi:ribosomal protein L14E/L6E/L27E
VALIEQGRVCIVTRGADAGKEVVVSKIIDKNFVMVVGERVKERRANIRHLEPTPRTAKEMPTPKVRPPKERPLQQEPQKPKPEKPKKEKVKAMVLPKKEKETK